MSDSFVIEAEVAWSIGLDGTVFESTIIARVKNENGEPEIGLKKSNFKLHAVDFAIKSPTISSVLDTETSPGVFLPGTYLIKFDNTGLGRGQVGQYVFTLIVSKSVRVMTAQGKPGTSISTGQVLMSVVKLK
jgi:hypothetical protein